MTSIQLSTDKNLLQVNRIHAFLSQSYWAKDIPISIVQKSIDHSMCFGVYKNDLQIGFARVITDQATFAYLADVYIIEEEQGKGYSKQLMHFIMNHQELQGLRRFMLATRDAHGLYEAFGFATVAIPERIMEIVRPGIYERAKQE